MACQLNSLQLGFGVLCCLQRSAFVHSIAGLRGRASIGFSSYYSRLNNYSTNVVNDVSAHNLQSSRDECNFMLPTVEFDWNYLCNSDNLEEIRRNILNRKGIGDIEKVHALWKSLHSMEQDVKCDTVYRDLKRQLYKAASEIPNQTHPDSPVGDETKARQLMQCGQKIEFRFPPKSAVEIGESLDILRTQHVGHSSGSKTYYLKSQLAHMEKALVQFTLENLLRNHNFALVSVPNLVRRDIVECCGFKTSGERTQVYRVKLDQPEGLCLAGTGEFPLAGLFFDQCFKEEDLPKRVATVSHCYRAETSDIARESGIYRVHQFTKVEMFAVTANEMSCCESDAMLSEFVGIQKLLFELLGLTFRVLEMPTQELGAPAYRKIDMEAWLPARQFWGEISSTSNCTDYQSRRLGIKYVNSRGDIRHCHTVNGTACAVPRMLIALLESYQQSDGTVSVPKVLQRYMNHAKLMTKPANPVLISSARMSQQVRKKQQKLSDRFRWY